MPVGNSDRGIGLGAGEVMVFADLAYQKFDWWHDKIPGAYVPDTNIEEDFDHQGLFVNKSFSPFLDKNLLPLKFIVRPLFR